MFIDLNADVAEGIGNEKDLMPFLSSCNLCCGAHAGSRKITEKVLLIAKEHNISVGAHPSYPDRKNFGRVKMNISANALVTSLKEQLELIFSLAEKHRYSINYIKPHGALYHECASNLEFAHIILEVIKEFDSNTTLLGLPNSKIQDACKIHSINEAHRRKTL